MSTGKMCFKGLNNYSAQMIVVSRSFSPKDLVGGHPALDLINTVTARNTTTPRDWLDDYERLLEWARLANITEEKTLILLRKQAAGSVRAAARALARLKEFREALHTAYAAVLTGELVSKEVLDGIGAIWQVANSRARLEYSDGRVEVRFSVTSSGLDLIRDCLVAGAIALLSGLPTNRARICRGEACGWLFLDSSKGGQRVWCDMATCGNAAKTRRHQKNMKRGPLRTASNPSIHG